MAKKKMTKWHTHPNFIIALAVTLVFLSGYVVFAGNNANKGFDELGYNRSARVFSGPADGVDGKLDGKVWGDTTYANDHLKMKWNAEWDRGNSDGWANPPYAAWEDNEWNGSLKGGSGEMWQYKIKWVGPCGATGTTLDDGSYCIWGQFAVIASHGVTDNDHFWEAHAVPSGFGVKP